MKQLTFLGTRDERSAGHTITSGFWGRIAKALRKATRSPVVIHGVLVADSRVQWRPLSADPGMQIFIGIFFAVVPILFPNCEPPRCDRRTLDSIVIVHIVLDLAS
jgi:hypothetical protein